jgi:cell division protein FtsN
MHIFSVLFSLICLSFLIVVVGAIVFALFMKQRMEVFREVQMDEIAFNNGPVVDAQYETIDEAPPSLSPHHSEPES